MADQLTDDRRERFLSGESDDAYTFMGAHLNGDGCRFRVWAPNARSVRLVGDFNFWNTEEIFMSRDDKGIWTADAPARNGDRYKYFIERCDGSFVYKTDPYAFRCAPLPDTSGVVWDGVPFEWTDGDWRRSKKDPLDCPMNIYELHLGSWKRHEDGTYYSYAETAAELIPYVRDMGYTHIELMPVTEYPYDGSWGYQVTGYYAPTHRFGPPEDLKKLINDCHAAGIGVIMDWVPAHFPKDEYGLCEFDGTCCYEVSDPLMREHRDWNTRVFDYSRYEVRSFLLSSALYWIREYHADGIRVDAVAAMLYLDYGRNEYTPNEFGGNHNLHAIDFFRTLNARAFREDPAVIMAAEESTAFPLVTRPPEMGGLGFNFKWNMGWMNDILRYMKTDPIFRKEVHNDLTFSMTYAFSENYILPLSHDEVVHLKKSLVDKMPGDYWDKFANLRTLLGFMAAHPGKKLTFMGADIAQFGEWNYTRSIDWFLLGYESHAKHQNYVRSLNRFYRDHPAFWDNERGWEGFAWISLDDRDNSVVAFRRIGRGGDEVVCIFNFCPVCREHYRLGLPQAGTYAPVFSSDDSWFGGSAVPLGKVPAVEAPLHNCPYSGEFTIPPLSATFYIRES